MIMILSKKKQLEILKRERDMLRDALLLARIQGSRKNVNQIIDEALELSSSGAAHDGASMLRAGIESLIKESAVAEVRSIQGELAIVPLMSEAGKWKLVPGQRLFASPVSLPCFSNERGKNELLCP